jgi:hypothetical protein
MSSLLFYLILFAAFIILCAAFLSLGDLLLKRRIREELGKRGYKLISAEDAEETFESPKPVSKIKPASFREYLKIEHGVTIGGHSRYPARRRTKLYKEVQFSIPGNKTIKTLVSAKMLLIFPHELHFNINLDDLK